MPLENRPIRTYQESIVAWAPGPTCLKLVSLNSLLVLPLGAFIYFWLPEGFPLLPSLFISLLATVWEMYGIVWGQSESRKLISKLQVMVPEVSETLFQEAQQKMESIWRNKVILLVGVVFAIAAGFFVHEIVSCAFQDKTLKVYLSLWISWGMFWCGAASYHVVGVPLLFAGLAKQSFRSESLSFAVFGFRELGRLALRYFAYYALAAVWWIAAAVSIPFKPHWIVPVMVGYGIVLGAIMFFLPQWPIHRSMREFKVSSLASVLNKIDETRKRIVGRSGRKYSTEEFKAVLKLYEFTAGLPTWPFDLSVLVRFISLNIVQFLLLLYQYLKPN